MAHKFFRQGLNAFILLFVAAFLVLALYSAIGQQIFPRVGEYQHDVEAYVSERLDAHITMGKLWGGMDLLTPSIHIEGLTLQESQSEAPTLSVAAIDAILDPRLSIINMTPVFKSVRLSGLSMTVARPDEENEEDQQTPESDDDSPLQSIIDALLLQQHVELNGVTVHSWFKGKQRTLQLNHLVMTGDGFHRLLTGNLSYGDEKPIKTGFRIYSEGSPYDLDTFYARGALDFPESDIGYWLEQLTGENTLDQFEASAQLNFEFEQGLLQTARLKVASTELSVPKQPAMKNLLAEVWLKQESPQVWTSWLSQGDFTINEQPQAIQDIGLRLSRRAEGNRWQLFAQKGDLSKWQSLIQPFSVLPESVTSILDQLKPAGEVHQLHVVLDTKPNLPLEYTVAAQIQDLSVDSYEGVPAARHVNGVLAANQNGGRVQFLQTDKQSTLPMTLLVPGVYDSALILTEAQGQIDWHLRPHQVHIVGDGLKLAMDKVTSVSGGFQVWIPTDLPSHFVSSVEEEPVSSNSTSTVSSLVTEAAPVKELTESDQANAKQSVLTRADKQAFQKRETKLLLNLGFSDVDALAHTALVPQDLDEGLVEWLNGAIKGGRVSQGQLLLMTSLEDKSPDPILELHLGIQNARLAYLEEWPDVNNITGDLFIDSQRVVGHISQADSLGGVVKRADVRFTQAKNLPTLWVGLEAAGAAAEGVRYFTETPLQEAVSGALDQWQISGNNDLSLGLKIPFVDDSELAVDVRARLQNADLKMHDLDLTFNHINGTIGYSTEKGLHASKIQAELWQQKIEMQAASHFVVGDMVSEFSFNGTLNAAGLKDWLQLGLLESLSGTGPVSGQFILDTQTNAASRLLIDSSLEGLSLDLPKPFGKSPQESRGLNLSLALESRALSSGDEETSIQTLKLAYSDDVNLAIEMRDGDLFGGQIFIGETEAYVPNDPGLVIKGHIDRIDAVQWQAVWEKIEAQDAGYEKQRQRDLAALGPQPLQSSVDKANKNASNKSESASEGNEKPIANRSPINKIVVSTDTLVYEEQRFESVQAEIQQLNGDWVVKVDAPIVRGQVSVFENKPMLIDLDYIHWPQSTEEVTTEEPSESVDVLAELNPADFPALSFKIKEIFVGPRNFGSWQLDMEPIKNGARFYNINGEIKKLAAKGEVKWIKDERHQSFAKVELKSSDVAGIQRAWHIKPAVDAKKAVANLDFNWQGSPANFEVASLNGELSFKLENGSFVEAKDASALNVFGILNFGAIGRRLRLDFSDLYQSGLHYDSFKGKTTISNGLVRIVDTMIIEGPAAKFEANGTINLNTKALDQNLSVTFPISSTLPLVAILAGFAPPVAASIYIGEKLVGDELSRFTSATYSIKGTWDDPKLELNKRFNDQIEGKKTRSFWHKMRDIFTFGDD